MVATSDKYYLNNPLIDSDTCIIVTSHAGHLTFLKYALTKYMESGKYVICSYDSHSRLDIPQDIFNIPYSWTFKHITYGAEKRNGWLWDVCYAAGVVHLWSFDYIFITNGDCIWDRPKGINNLIKYLGDYDFIASSSNGTIHTAAMLWKRDAFLSFVSKIRYYLDKNVKESYSPEVILRDWFLEQNKFRKKVPEKQAKYPKGHRYAGNIDHYSSYHQDSTFKDILGFRNLGGEHKWSCLEHLSPVPKRYFDLRDKGRFLSAHERNTLYNYYITNDRRWLYMYWDQGEDSDYNRKYFPLKHYGDVPLFNDSKRKVLGPDSERKGLFDRFNLDFINK